jgi:hypothetical protein
MLDPNADRHLLVCSLRLSQSRSGSDDESAGGGEKTEEGITSGKGGLRQDTLNIGTEEDGGESGNEEER